jgi:hypothetical protein
LENSTRFPEIIDLYEEVLLQPFRAGWVPILPGDYVQGQRNSPESQEIPDTFPLTFKRVSCIEIEKGDQIHFHLT